MMNIGRFCIKTAGRDAGKKCIIVDIIDANYVLIDGETRRRKCNIKHLEPIAETAEIEKNATHEEVAAAMKSIGIDVVNKMQKTGKTEKPAQLRKKPGAEEKKVRKKKEKKQEKKTAIKSEDKKPAKPAEKKAKK